MEHGVRIELRELAAHPRRGSESAAQLVAVDRPLWRADLFDRLTDAPGRFGAAHYHPRFLGDEPCPRVWDARLTADPWSWLGDQFAQLGAAGVTAPWPVNPADGPEFSQLSAEIVSLARPLGPDRCRSAARCYELTRDAAESVRLMIRYLRRPDLLDQERVAPWRGTGGPSSPPSPLPCLARCGTCHDRVGAEAPATGDACGWRQVRACPDRPWRRASAGWPGGCDQGQVMTRYAVPGPPVQLPHGHADAAGVPQHGGVAVRAVIDDAQPAAGPQHPHRLAQRLCPPLGVPDVGERQAADHRQPGEPAVDAVPAPLPGATTAFCGRDLRDWLHAASLPATITGEAVLHELSGIRQARPVRYRPPNRI